MTEVVGIPKNYRPCSIIHKLDSV